MAGDCPTKAPSTSASAAGWRWTRRSADDRVRPRPGRADRRADHVRPAGLRVRRAGRRRAAVAGRRDRRARDVPVAVRDRVDHRRVDLRHQPDDRARARPGHRLQPVHGVPLPRGAAGRARRRGGGRAGDADGRANGRAERVDRGGLAVRAARVPAVLPALVRLRRHRRRAGAWPARCSPCRRCWRRRDAHRRPAGVPAPAAPEESAALAPHRPEGDATPGAGRRHGVVVLLLLGSPFLGVRFGNPDARMLPDSEPARMASEQLQDDFGGDASEAFPVLLADGAADPAGARWTDWRPRSAGWPGWTASTSVRPRSPSSRRSRWSPPRATCSCGHPRPDPDGVLVGGPTASLVDTRASIASRLPLALASSP